jgi:uncharacterized NAD-dependent epimerase/dehydratase family protein
MSSIPASTAEAGAAAVRSFHPPYVLFLGDVQDKRMAKTASGVYYWVKDACIAQVRLPGCQADLGLPDVTVETARRMGARTLVVGLAPIGGDIPASWVPTLAAALASGLDIASGMHIQLNDNQTLTALAARHGRRMFDIRRAPAGLPIATGRRRRGKRLLTVGTDCGVGKMFAALAIVQEMRRRGLRADFRATGQTGILIAGEGICIDAVVSDFAAGATELLSPDNDVDHWDVVEGQGSLFHPSYAGVTLALLHGSQPDQIVMCHDAAREDVVGMEGYPLPSLEECIETNLQLGRRVNPGIAVAGICVNTSAMAAAEARAYIDATCQRLKLPVCDPVRTGVASIVDRL